MRHLLVIIGMNSILKKIILSVFIFVFAFNLTAYSESYGQYYYRIENEKAVITDMVKPLSGEIVIPSTLGDITVWAIDDWAFEINADITCVALSAGVQKIGDGAFSGCRNMTDISIPNTVTRIGVDSFWNCTALKTIIIPDSVKTIGMFAFSNCNSLENVIIGSGVSRISEYMFEKCSELKEVHLSDSISCVDIYAFTGCEKLTDIYYAGDKTARSMITVLEGNERFETALWHYNNDVKGIRAGDINGDGNTNNKDLTRLFQYLSDWDVTVNIAALDTNADGSVNNKDMTRLFQYLSDWKVKIF